MNNIRIGKVTRLGNGLAIVIPRSILRGLKIQRGDQVVFAVYDENIFCVRRLTDDELQKMRPENLQF
jgi:antitoxin component of MazEF toxin-antitoxin module